MLENLITSKTRLRLLIKFFISQANKGHLNGLASEMGESTNSIRKELNHLFEAGYLNKTKKENKVEYNVNIKHPLYDTMKKVVMKHLGLEDIVETVLGKMGNVEENLEVKIEKLISRKVTFYLSSKFSSKQKSIVLYKNI
jgi:predicted transcriptional regulator